MMTPKTLDSTQSDKALRERVVVIDQGRLIFAGALYVHDLAIQAPDVEGVIRSLFSGQPREEEPLTPRPPLPRAGEGEQDGPHPNPVPEGEGAAR